MTEAQAKRDLAWTALRQMLGDTLSVIRIETPAPDTTDTSIEKLDPEEVLSVVREIVRLEREVLE